jgi:hypothetical protein
MLMEISIINVVINFCVCDQRFYVLNILCSFLDVVTKRFGKCDWASVRESLNQAGRDKQKKN